MNINTKFRAWDVDSKEMMLPTMFSLGRGLPFTNDNNGGVIYQVVCNGNKHIVYHDIILMESSGFIDKNGKDIFFNSDIIKVPDYEYDEKWGAGFKRCKIDLIFMLEKTFFGTEINIINKPEGLTVVSLWVLFNYKNMYHHLNYPSKMEVIGNKYQRPDLLT